VLIPRQGSRQPSEAALLAEYAAANDVYLTYDGFRWQAGSFLIAGVFVYWGFLISTDESGPLVVVSSVLVALLMSCWLLFAHHYRQLYMFKLHRLHEIEAALGMEQHLRFGKQAPSGVRYIPMGRKGHTIDIAVYVLTALGGSVLSMVKNGFSVWELVVVPLAVVIVWHVMRNEHKLATQYRPGFPPTDPRAKNLPR